MHQPVPEVLRAVRNRATVGHEHRMGMDAHAREAMEQARQTLGAVSREALADQAERLDDLAMTFPTSGRGPTTSPGSSRLQDERREAHESRSRFPSPRCALDGARQAAP